MTSTSLKNNTNAFPSTLPYVCYSILPATHVQIFSLQFANLRKPISALAKLTSYAIKFYPDTTSNPVYNVCRQHRITHSNMTEFSDTSWQDCPDTGPSTVWYMIFHNGALIEANSTMPTPIAMSTSEAEYMAACSASMATAHICMLVLYNMTYIGTKQWRKSTQYLPTIPSILMIDNEATVQIARNGKLSRKIRHIEQRFHYVRQGQQDSTHQLHWIPCELQIADILTKTQVSSKIDLHIDKVLCTLPDHMLQPSNNSTEIWFKRGVRHSVLPYLFLHLSLSLVTVARVHSNSQPCSSNQCDTARLESKLTRRFKQCSSHPMRMNTRFQTRLNASYTDDSTIRGV